jgi:hypothetical protein
LESIEEIDELKEKLLRTPTTSCPHESERSAKTCVDRLLTKKIECFSIIRVGSQEEPQHLETSFSDLGSIEFDQQMATVPEENIMSEL